ncbi:MAG: hypothetical protein JSS91_08525 [Bacteroidetes bacterium]|nr:hypothetical protein [Bacteroidota bacterium]
MLYNLKFYYSTLKNIQSAVFIFSFLLFAFINKSSAQNIHDINSPNGIYLNGNETPDSVKQKSGSSTTFKMKKQPWRAVAYSAVIPGAGQLYNKTYWKIPVILGLGGYFAYGIINNNNKYSDYRDQYLNSQTEQNPSGDPQLLNLREFYRDQRDNFIIYSAILYLANLIDAYIDAQLYDFNVSDKIKLGLLKDNKLIGINYSF